MRKEYYKGFITKLSQSEVFVFGSNALGFHGAGTAGLAYRGNPSGWYSDKSYQKDIRTFETNRFYRNVGEWAIFGQAKGLMQGRSGKSYGIVTCTRPGNKKSVALEDIYNQLIELNNFAKKNKNMKFFSTIVGGGYSGYSFIEFGILYTRLESEYGISENIILPESLRSYVKKEN